MGGGGCDKRNLPTGLIEDSQSYRTNLTVKSMQQYQCEKTALV